MIITYLLNMSLYFYLNKFELYYSINQTYFTKNALAIISDRLKEHFHNSIYIYLNSYEEYCNEIYLKYLQFLVGFNELKWLNSLGNGNNTTNSFGDLSELNHGEFNFSANKIFIWENGKAQAAQNYNDDLNYTIKNNITDKINNISIIKTPNRLSNSIKDFDVENVHSLNDIIKSVTTYYSMIKINDRLMFLNIPINSKDVSVNGIKYMINMYNVTYYPDFIDIKSTNNFLNLNEPYACSLFYESNKLHKIYFSLSDNRLIEFIQ